MVKFHIVVDSETGLVHTFKVTSGNVSDIAEATSLLHSEEQFVHGDAGIRPVWPFWQDCQCPARGCLLTS
ncbi:transposase [Methylomonas sp. BW4-1]|uniref:transposase n=1 Tax=Methylomonas sp. BW4-1 TaxID=3376685 RepID=UPI0040422EFF